MTEDKKVELRIKYRSIIKDAGNLSLLYDYKYMIRNGHGDNNWMLDTIEKEILERMSDE